MSPTGLLQAVEQSDTITVPAFRSCGSEKGCLSRETRRVSHGVLSRVLSYKEGFLLLACFFLLDPFVVLGLRDVGWVGCREVPGLRSSLRRQFQGKGGECSRMLIPCEDVTHLISAPSDQALHSGTPGLKRNEPPRAVRCWRFMASAAAAKKSQGCLGLVAE